MIDRPHAHPSYSETILTGPLQFPTEREIWQHPLLAETASESAAKRLNQGQAWRIAVNIAKLPELIRKTEGRLAFWRGRKGSTYWIVSASSFSATF